MEASLSNVVFQNALQKHIDRWNSDPRSFPSFSNPKDILEEVANYEQQHAKSAGRRYTVRFSSLIDRFKSIFGVIDTLVSSNSHMAAQIVWGGLKFIIQMASNYSSYFGKVVVVLETITQSLHFYHDYATELYKDSDRLLQVLAEAYGDILDILMTVKKVFINSKNQPRFGAIVAIRVFFDDGLDNVLANFDQRRIFLEGEASHMDRKKRLWADQQNELDKLLGILQFPDSDCARKHATVQDGQLDYQPCLWFLQSEKFLQWSSNSNPAPGLFWIHGKPGVGKTFLSWIAIENIKASRSHVGFFYCDYQNPDKCDPSKLLASILHQFISRFRSPLPPVIAELLVEYRGKYSSTNSLEGLPLADWLCKIATKLDHDVPFIIIDALDECKDRAKLFPVLKRVASFSRLLITSRKETDIETSLDEYLSFSIIIQQEDTQDDIRRFVESQIQDHIDRNPSFTRNLDLVAEIKEALILNADGMFLWVVLQLKYLFDQRSDFDIRAAIRDLPRGLESTYVRSLTRIDEHPSCERLKRVLRWVVCAVHPLTPLALAEAVAFDEMHDHWNQEMVVNDEYSLINDCAHLLSTVDVGEGNIFVRLIHFSVYNFLTLNPLLCITTLPLYHVYPLSSAHFTIALNCIKIFKMLPDGYLSAATSSSDPLRTFCGSHLYRYARRSWGRHLLSSESVAASSPFTKPSTSSAQEFPDFTSINIVNRSQGTRILGDRWDFYFHSIDKSTWSRKFSMQQMFSNAIDIEWVNKSFDESGIRVNEVIGRIPRATSVDRKFPDLYDNFFNYFFSSRSTRCDIFLDSIIISISDNMHSHHQLFSGYPSDVIFNSFNNNMHGGICHNADNRTVKYTFKASSHGEGKAATKAGKEQEV